MNWDFTTTTINPKLVYGYYLYLHKQAGLTYLASVIDLHSKKSLAMRTMYL